MEGPLPLGEEKTILEVLVQNKHWRFSLSRGWSIREGFFVPSVWGESEVEFEDGVRRRQSVKKEGTQIMESESSNQLGVEGLTDSIELSEILRMEATSVLDLGRMLGLSYGLNEFELLQQVLS